MQCFTEWWHYLTNTLLRFIPSWAGWLVACIYIFPLFLPKYFPTYCLSHIQLSVSSHPQITPLTPITYPSISHTARNVHVKRGHANNHLNCTKQILNLNKFTFEIIKSVGRGESGYSLSHLKNDHEVIGERSQAQMLQIGFFMGQSWKSGICFWTWEENTQGVQRQASFI